MITPKLNEQNKGKHFMRFHYGCGTGIIKSENSGYYFTENDAIVGKHNVVIISKEEYDALNEYYKSLSKEEFEFKDSISYMDGLKDLELIREKINK